MTKHLPLTDRRFALVDDDTYECAAKYRWSMGRGANGQDAYVERDRKHGGSRFVHRLVLGEPPAPGLEVDHRNGDKLDCRRRSLRWVTHRQDMQSRSASWASSGFRNVYGRPPGKWALGVRIDGQLRYFGSYASLEEAAAVADRVRKEHWGEFAPDFGGAQ